MNDEPVTAFVKGLRQIISSGDCDKSAVTPIATKMVQRRECEGRQLVGSVQSRFFLADLREVFFMLAFFFSVVRLLEATAFFVRELGFFAPIAVATLFQTAPGAAVAVVAAAWANSPTKVLVPLAAVFPAATTVSCALVMMLLRAIFPLSRPEDTQKHRTRDNQSLEEVRGLCWFDSVRFGS
jgi:hypothetical protein